MKQSKPSSTSFYIEISILVLTLFILLTPVFIIIKNQHSGTDSSSSTDSSSTQENTRPKNTEQNAKPTQPTEPTDSQTTPSEQSPSPTTSTEQPSTPTQPAPTPSAAPTPTTPTCHHEEQGVCWDELEDANYSAGLYDRENANYGATIDYPDSCDSVCRDIIDDAYEEGWYDGDY